MKNKNKRGGGMSKKEKERIEELEDKYKDLKERLRVFEYGIGKIIKAQEEQTKVITDNYNHIHKVKEKEKATEKSGMYG